MTCHQHEVAAVIYYFNGNAPIPKLSLSIALPLSPPFFLSHVAWVFRIDDNVEDAAVNVEAAHTELLKYFKGITSSRWLMVKIFVVVLVFFIVFIVFFA